jgi:hypothetical protein
MLRISLGAGLARRAVIVLLAAIGRTFVGIACMTAEHDDCHLARIRELIRSVRR